MGNVIAHFDILYNGRMYKKGEVISGADEKMIEAWKKTGAATLVKSVLQELEEEEPPEAPAEAPKEEEEEEAEAPKEAAEAPKEEAPEAPKEEMAEEALSKNNNKRVGRSSKKNE